MSFHFEVFQRMALSQLWQLTAVICVAGLFTLLVSRRRPHLAYVLWLIVLIKAVTPPIWSSPTGVFSWTNTTVAQSAVVVPPMGDFTHVSVSQPDEILNKSQTETSTEPRLSGSGPETSFHSSPPSRSGLGFSGQNIHEVKGMENTDLSPQEDAASVSPVSDGAGSDMESSQEAHGVTMFRLAEVLAVVWLCGAAALGGLLIGRWSYYFVLLRHHRVDSDDRILNAVKELSKRLGVRRRVDVLITTRPFGPAVCGLWRPMLILPQALLEEESAEHIERIIAHELIHVRRGDNLVGVLQLFAQVVWWFHPLVWWTNRRMCVEREQCCDEQVVASLRCDPGTYAQSLLDVLKLRRQLRPAILPGVDAPEVTKKRLENIMDHRKTFHRRMPIACWIMLIVGVMLVVPGAGFTVSAQDTQPSITATDKEEVVSLVKSFLSAVTQGRINEARRMLGRHRPNEQKELQQMGFTLAPQNVKVARVTVKVDKATVYTSKILHTTREGVLRFDLHKKDGLWFITEIDFEREIGHVIKSVAHEEGKENILLNPGVEEGKTSPSHWTKGTPVDSVTYIWDRKEGHESNRSLCLEKKANRYFPIAQWSQTIERKGTSPKLQLRTKVRAERVQKAVIDVIFLDDQDKWISHEWASFIGAKVPGEKPAYHDWKNYEGIVHIPEKTKKISIGLQMYGPGKVWFDDVQAMYVANDKAAASGEFDEQQLMQLGWAYWRKGQFDKAADKFTRVERLNPNNANAWNGLGWARFNSGKLQQAKEAFERAVKLQPNHAAALNGLGQLYLFQRKYDLAEKYLLKAAPNAQAAWFGLSRLYLLQGKFEQAEPWAQKIVGLAQGDKESLDQARLLLKAAKEKHLGEDLRTLIEPPLLKDQELKETSHVSSDEPGAKSVVGMTHKIALNESVDLQKLIDEAKPGGVVTVPPGEYDKSITIDKPITLVGEDAEKCILELVSDKPILMLTSKKPATIDSLTFRWKRATSRRSAGPTGAIAAKDARATLKNCRIIASGSPARCPAGINCEGFSDVDIENCYCKGFEYCINYSGGAEGKISDCVVVNPGHCGITVYTNSKIDVARCIVTGSRFHGLRSTGGTIMAHDNLIIENKNRGIYLGNRPASGVIRNNVILGNGAGISAYAGTDTKIVNNLFAKCDFAGLAAAAAAPILVKDNIFYNNAKGFVVFQNEGRDKVKLQENTYWKNKENTENVEPTDNSIVADPKFKNYRRGDFMPQAKKIVEAKQGLTDPSVITKLWKKWKALSKD